MATHNTFMATHDTLPSCCQAPRQQDPRMHQTYPARDLTLVATLNFSSSALMSALGLPAT